MTIIVSIIIIVIIVAARHYLISISTAQYSTARYR